MAERKLIHIEPAGETGKLLKLVGGKPITVESNGVRYWIEREEQDLFNDYDPAQVLAALRKGIGLYEGVDIEKFKREIWEQRTQDSSGRPA